MLIPLAGLVLAAGLLCSGAAVAQTDAGNIATTATTATTDRLMHAFDLVGTPYHRRGSTPETGFDCSGFIGWIFRDANGIELPRSAHEIYGLGASRAAKIDRDALEPGDLVFFHIGRVGKRVDHVGMYVGEGRFVHSPASGGEVRIDTLELPYWRKHYAGARRILDASAASGALDADEPPVGLAADAGIGKDSVSQPADTQPLDNHPAGSALPEQRNKPQEAAP